MWAAKVLGGPAEAPPPASAVPSASVSELACAGHCVWLPLVTADDAARRVAPTRASLPATLTPEEEFGENFCWTLSKLDLPSGDRSRLSGVGYCRAVVVGQPGAGESPLLTKLVNVGQSLARRTLFCCLNYNTDPDGQPPVAIFCDKLISASERFRPHLDGVKTLDLLAAWLEYVNLRLVFVVDEIEAVYRMQSDVGTPILQELAGIGEYQGSRSMVAYLAGSSPVVHRLCFAELRREEEQAYPSYHSWLRFSKYAADTVDPTAARQALEAVQQRSRLAPGAPAAAVGGGSAAAPLAGAGAAAAAPRKGDDTL